MEMVNRKILVQFAEFLEKQDMLSKLTEHEKLHGYGYSEIHVIAAIGDLMQPNVTEIARTLKLTKGAVSKITKRLMTSSMIEAYHQKGNKQKIFFKLTSEGNFLYEEHDRRHRAWVERDQQFLVQFSQQQLQWVSEFMSLYNDYLKDKIIELGGQNHAD